MKRWRKVRANEGELKVAYGRDEDGNVDVCFANGPGTSHCDGHLLHSYLECERYISTPLTKEGYRLEKSLRQELEERGYDITTLKFSIQKKKGGS